METASTVRAKKSLPSDGFRYYLSYLRSLVFTNPLIYLYTILCGTASLCGSIVDSGGRWQHKCARAWSWLILRTSGIRVEVRGLENVDPKKTMIYCSNHASAMDIPIMFVYLPLQFRFLAKRSLFRLPFLGWHLTRSGHIPIDRQRPREAMKGFDRAAKRIREGNSVVMFPEGRRSRTVEMLPFKSGSFYLAILAGVPIAPITLNGTRNVLVPDTYHVRAGQTQLVIHPPISTEGMTLENVDELSDRVRRQIVSALWPAENN